MDNIEELFARASRLGELEGYHTNLELVEWNRQRELNGARVFKRKALGFCGKSSIKTLDEMAELLCKTNIVSSVQEGRKLVPSLKGNRVPYVYTGMALDERYIVFTEVKDSKGNEAIKVEAYIPKFTAQ